MSANKAGRVVSLPGGLRGLSFERTKSAHKNEDRCGDRTPCARCGLPIKDLANAASIHIVDGGCVALHPEDETKYVPDSGDLSFYPVGPECAKHFRGFLFLKRAK